MQGPDVLRDASRCFNNGLCAPRTGSTRMNAYVATGRRFTGANRRLNQVLSFNHKGVRSVRLAAAAAGFLLLAAFECPAASKITSWEIGKVLGAEGKKELVGTAEHSSTFGSAS